MNINEIQNKLNNYEKTINDSEKKKFQLEGKQESLLEKLKNEYEINKIEEIDNLIEKEKEELDNIENEMQENIEELEKYNWE